MALPKSHRLSLRFNRDRLTKTGKTFHGEFFTLVSAPLAPNVDGSEMGGPRLAILLSKKTANLAVDRNKIKRITSALLETSLKSIPIKDYLVIPKKQVLIEKFEVLLKDLQNLLSK